MTVRTTVANLSAGQVMSMPDADLEPAVIQGISDPVGDVRFIMLTDLDSGEPLPSRLVLGTHRTVLVHSVKVPHQHYTNISEDNQQVRLGRHTQDVAPFEQVHYTGKERPDMFDPSTWPHHTEPIEIDREPRSL